MIKAVFPGSFDPPTNGHLDIIQRASKLFDDVDVLISVNPNKNYMFTEQERLEMLKELLKNYKNVQIHVWEGLIVNYAKEVGARNPFQQRFFLRIRACPHEPEPEPPDRNNVPPIQRKMGRSKKQQYKRTSLVWRRYFANGSSAG